MHDAPINERKHDYDWPLAASVLGLMIIGTAFIFSATPSQSLYLRQVLAVRVRRGRRPPPPATPSTRQPGPLVGFVLLGIDCSIAGGNCRRHRRSPSWRQAVDFWVFLQPSEFAKIGFILWLANYLSRPKEELRQGKVFLAILGFTLLPFILVLKEPDMGSALVFLTVSLAMMFVAGVPFRMLAGLVAGVGLLVILGLALILYAPPKFKIMESYQERPLAAILRAKQELQRRARR